MKNTKEPKTYNWLWFGILGFAFGLFYIVLGTILAMYVAHVDFTLQNAIRQQLTNPLLWLIDTAPFILAAALALVGFREDKVISTRRQLERALQRRSTDLKKVNAEIEKQTHERQEQEEIISRGKRQWEATFDSVEDIIVVTDTNGMIIRCNRTTSDAFQTGFRQLIGRQVDELFYGANGEHLPTQKTEVRFPRLEGWHEVSSSPLMIEGGRQGTIFIIRNITDRKQAAIDLQRQKQYYKSLVRNSPIAIVTLDLEQRIVACNPAFEILFGYRQQEVLGRDLDSLVAPAALLEETKSITAMVRKGEIVHHVTQRRRKDSSLLDVELYGVPVIVGGKQIGILGLYNDITELVQARRQAEEGDRAKSIFLANLSHELRTPLNGVIGMLELTLDTPLNPEQEDYLKTSLKSAEELMIILNDLLDLSKIEARRLDLEVIDFNLRSSVEDVARALAHRAQSKGLELACMIPPEVPLYLRGDPGRLRQVLVNLVGNAIKFTEQGEVVIRVGLVSETEQDASIRFEVQDTGIGIEKDRQQAIFERFVQADDTISREYGGTGLGLTISKQLVELMGGTIGVVSEVGKGSTFIFTVAFEKQSEQEDKLFVAPSDLQGVHILAVDDNATNRTILEKMLEGFGCRVALAAAAGEGIALMRQAISDNDSFQVVLLDMQMPEMDGRQAAQLIRSDPDLSQSQLIILTSYGERGDAMYFKDLGCDGYLLKPILMAQLFEAVLSVVGKPGKEKKQTGRLVTRHTISEQMKERPPILLADDDEVSRKLVSTLLEKSGYQVETAKTGMDVLNAAQQENYGLILMDAQMPEMDGFEATRLIRQLNAPARLIPIVAMTAHAMKGDRERCLEAGMNDYIPKPINPDILFAVIEHWLQVSPEDMEALLKQPLEPVYTVEEASVVKPFVDEEEHVAEAEDVTRPKQRGYKIETIEGIGPVYRSKLSEAGVTTTDELLDAAATRKGRQDLAQKTGISEKLVLAWANKADLMRVPGVGEGVQRPAGSCWGGYREGAAQPRSRKPVCSDDRDK